MKPSKDLAGIQFGDLTVLRRDGRAKYFVCLCVCGRESSIRADRLTVGLKTDCGCKGKIERHGETGTPEYRAWVGMNSRTVRPGSARRYYERGIKVCDEWARSYTAFLACVGRKPSPLHTLDRIDNDGNYEPGNVRWATPTEQQNNRTVTRRIDYQGRSYPITELAKLLNVNINTLRSQARRGKLNLSSAREVCA